MSAEIELANRLEPIVLPGVSTRRLANVLNSSMRNGEKLFMYEETPGDENPVIFNLDRIVVIRPYDDDAVGPSY